MRTLLLAAVVTLGTFARSRNPSGRGQGRREGRTTQEPQGPPGRHAEPRRPDARLYASVGAMDCNFCHDPNGGKDSDANPKKLKARMMIPDGDGHQQWFRRRQRARHLLHLPSRQRDASHCCTVGARVTRRRAFDGLRVLKLGSRRWAEMERSLRSSARCSVCCAVDA